MSEGLPREWSEVLDGVRRVAQADASLGETRSGTRLDTAVWQDLQDGGFTLVGAPEEAGGLGGPQELAAHITQVLAESRTSVPYADSVGLGLWLAVQGGFALDDAPYLPLIDVAQWSGSHAHSDPAVKIWSDAGRWTLDGRVPRVSWARAASHFLLVEPNSALLARVAARDCVIQPGSNLADEGFDTVMAHAAPVEVVDVDVDAVVTALLFRGALFRANALVGAMRQVAHLTVDYVTSRMQFGDALASLGAVQQLLAELAAEVVVCDTTVGAATRDLTRSESSPLPLDIAAAKARASRAAGRVSAIAHQLHGAMGISQEYPLQYWTRRLLAWRDEYGTEQFWEEWLGSRAAVLPTEDLWELVTSAGDSWQTASRMARARPERT